MSIERIIKKSKLFLGECAGALGIAIAQIGFSNLTHALGVADPIFKDFFASDGTFSFLATANSFSLSLLNIRRSYRLL